MMEMDITGFINEHAQSGFPATGRMVLDYIYEQLGLPLYSQSPWCGIIGYSWENEPVRSVEEWNEIVKGGLPI